MIRKSKGGSNNSQYPSMEIKKEIKTFETLLRQNEIEFTKSRLKRKSENRKG